MSGEIGGALALRRERRARAQHVNEQPLGRIPRGAPLSSKAIGPVRTFRGCGPLPIAADEFLDCTWIHALIVPLPAVWRRNDGFTHLNERADLIAEGQHLFLRRFTEVAVIARLPLLERAR